MKIITVFGPHLFFSVTVLQKRLFRQPLSISKGNKKIWIHVFIGENMKTKRWPGIHALRNLILIVPHINVDQTFIKMHLSSAKGGNYRVRGVKKREQTAEINS